jgi:hypothetical protein
MLAVLDAAAAVEWYKRALGATELWNLFCDDPDAVVVARPGSGRNQYS